MRILELNSHLSLAGGVETYLRRLTGGLLGRGHKVLAVGGGEPGTGWPAGVELRRTETAWELGASPRASRSVIELAAGFRPDVVHVHEVSNCRLVLELARQWPVAKHCHVDFTCASGGARFWRRTRRPCFRTVGPACLWHHYVDRCRPGWDPRWGLWSYRRATEAVKAWKALPRLLVASEFMRESLLKTGLEAARVEVLPLFVPSAEASPRQAGTGGAPEILFVGRIMPEKGLDDLVRALARVKRPCRLVVVGDGPARADAERLAARLGISGRVTFAGWQEDVAPLYRSASLLAVPSLWPEPFGIIGLEAMAQALPVVAYRSGGIPEWLADGVAGKLVEPGDVAGLGAAIDAILGDAELARGLGQAGQKRQRELFGPERHLDRLERVFAEAVAAGPKPG